MATIYRRKSTKKGPAKREDPHSYRVEFTFNRRRFHTSIRVRTKDQRDDFNANLSRMIRAAQAGLSLEPETELWAERLPDKVYDKLAAAGLIPRNHRAISIGRLIEQMRYKPISKAGEAARIQAHRSLLQYFGADKRIADISESLASSWWQAHGTKTAKGTELAVATQQKRLNYVKAVFNFAKRRGIITLNPFHEYDGWSQVNPKRRRYIEIREIEALRPHMDPEFFALVATVRLAGLRCPSEVSPLTWDDVDFERHSLMIRQAKIKCGGSKEPYRKCPMRTMLAEILRGIRPLSPQPGTQVFPDHPGSPCRNRYKLLRDAIDRAGIKAWEKPFVNLRASAITDFRRTGVSPVQVGDWTGNSTRIADKHYDLPFADQFICAVNLPLHLPDYPRAG